MTDPRAQLPRARRVVVKIGSSTLAGDAGVFERLAASIAARREASFVVVSSGAIALGMKKLGYRARPKEMARLQAAAAAGQSLLMRAYEQAFAARDLAVAQVLLTHADLADRTRANNARAALGALLEAGAVPILNENDSVAVDEIKFGDNDQLAAMVAPLVDADLVVLLSDVGACSTRQGHRIVRGARRRDRGGPARAGVRGRRGKRGHGEQGRGRAPGDARRRERRRRRCARARASSSRSSPARTWGRCSSRRATASPRRSTGSHSPCARAASSPRPGGGRRGAGEGQERPVGRRAGRSW